MYLYGNSTNFPLNENFLQTLGVATDTCVALLEIDERSSRVRKAVQMAKSDTISELAELGALRGAIERALCSVPESSPAATKAAAEVRELVYSHVEKSRAEVKHRSEQLQFQATTRSEGAAILGALERFLSTYQLPHTTWALTWWSGRQGDRCLARAYALMPRGLAATLDVRIPIDSIWAKPVRVSQLSKRLVIRMQRKSWLGGLRLGDEHLDRYYVSSVAKTPLQESLVLRRKAQEPSGGLRLTFRDGEVEQVIVQRIDANNQPSSHPMALGGSDKVMVQRLWAHVVQSISSLISHRSSVQLATLNGVDVGEIDRPAAVAKAIISAIGPWVRTIRRHSGTPGELCLRRVRDDGQQQDLVASFYEITRKYRHLPAPLRALFDALGLRDEPFTEIGTRAWRPRHEARRQPTPRRSQRSQPTMPTRVPEPSHRVPPMPPPAPSSPVPAARTEPPPAMPVAPGARTEPPPAMPMVMPAIAPPPPRAPVIELPIPRVPPSGMRPQPAQAHPLPQVFRLPPPSTPPPRPRLVPKKKIQIHSTPPPAEGEGIPTEPTRPALRVINGCG